MKTIAQALANVAEALTELSLAVEAAAGTPQDAPQAPLPFEDTPQTRSAQGGCPEHGLPWTVQPAGTSKKTGEPYNAFWKCNEMNDDGSYCRLKPAPAWVKAHPAR